MLNLTQFSHYILTLSPLILLITWREIKLHTSIAKIQTDIAWIKRELNQCQPTSENHIP